MIPSQSRITYIDTAKAIGIICVIIGHCLWKQSVPHLSHLIYLFHIPLFFIISGYFNKPMSLMNGYKKYGEAYLLPYFVGCFLVIVADIIKKDPIDCNILLKIVWASGSNGGSCMYHDIPAIGALWFLFALFWASLIFSFLQSMQLSLGKLICVEFALFCFAVWSFRYIRLPFSIQSGMAAVIYLHVGHYLRKKDVIHRLQTNNYVFIVAIWIIYALFSSGMTVNLLRFGKLYLGIPVSILASMAVLFFSSKIKMNNYIGTHTLDILLAHSFILSFIELFALLPFNYGVINFIIESFIQIVLSLLLSYPISILLGGGKISFEATHRKKIEYSLY